jgi:hypothetical protein
MNASLNAPVEAPDSPPSEALLSRLGIAPTIAAEAYEPLPNWDSVSLEQLADTTEKIRGELFRDDASPDNLQDAVRIELWQLLIKILRAFAEKWAARGFAALHSEIAHAEKLQQIAPPSQRLFYRLYHGYLATETRQSKSRPAAEHDGSNGQKSRPTA